MSDNPNRVEKLKVGITRIDAKVSKTGSRFLIMGLVREHDDSSKSFLDGMAFGSIGAALAASGLQKGKRVLVSGNLKTKEYTKADGTVGVNKTLFLSEVAFNDNNGERQTIDEFTPGKWPEIPNADADKEIPF